MKPLNILFTIILLGISFVLGGLYFDDYVHSFIGNTPLSSSSNNFETKGLQNVYSFLRDKYLYPDQINDKKDIELGSIKGLVNSLDDPYTVYFSKDEYNSFQENLEGKFEGIGAEIGLKEDKLIIVSPIDGTPANKAGLLPGDEIVTINGESTVGLSVEKAVTKIRGEKGTEVKLEIARKDQDGLKTFTIIREIIDIPNIKIEEKDGIAIISISQFQAETAQELDSKLAELNQKGVKKVVLDLRNNPGGYLQSAVEIIELFAPKGSIAVTEKSKNDKVLEELKTKKNPKYSDIKLVVLVNEGSASASEIVAGALRDLKKTQLIGKKTFGKGVVQSIQEFPDGSVLKYTIAEWFTPSGKAINKEGIKPDIEVELKAEDIKDKKDPQLDKALEIIKSL
jgi:carboxyl-terminal processing protease